MNKKAILILSTVITLIIVGAYIQKKQIKKADVQQTQDVAELSSATSTEKVSSSTPTKIVSSSVPATLQAYVDSQAKFSIVLPIGWSVADKVVSTTTPKIWFANASSTLVVGKYARNEESERKIEELGPGGFIDLIVNNTVSGFNQYNLVSTNSVTINGTPFRQVVSTYVGTKTNKQVTQYLYISLAKDSYYLIGLDVYSDIWDMNKGAILQSINTFKLL